MPVAPVRELLIYLRSMHAHARQVAIQVRTAEALADYELVRDLGIHVAHIHVDLGGHRFAEQHPRVNRLTMRRRREITRSERRIGPERPSKR